MRFLSLIVLISAPMLAQTTALDIIRQTLLRGVTYANLPSPATTNQIAVVTDCADSTCSTGGGSTVRLMRYNGSAWAVLGDGNTGSANDTAYDATSWDANTDAPTKNVVRDKIETLAPLVSPSFTTPNIGAATGTSLALGTTPASAGTARLPNNTEICWRNAANSADFCLKLNASNEFEFAAPINVTGTAGATLFTGVVSPSAPAGAEQWYFYADSVDNLPKYIYNGESEQTFYTTANPPTTISGNAGTATALASNPTDCSANQFANAIAASGNLTCAAIADADIPAAITRTIASGTKALDTDAIASTACDTLTTTTATGVASTDVVLITPNADITAVTGYSAATTGGLQIWVWPTANTLNWKVCNPTSSSITPGAVTLNYRVVR